MKIHYVTGSRADFGLMEETLRVLHATEELDVGIIATGQHLLKSYGVTLEDIEDSGLQVVHKIPVVLSGAGGAEMSHALADELAGLTDFWQHHRPDLVLILGDRGEMLAAALAAVHLGIFVGHLHGGEVSGTLDESFRHATSKLTHFHFPATDDSRERLIAMGEKAEHIWTIGAPGLVGLSLGQAKQADWFQQAFGIAQSQHNAVVVFHPVVQEAKLAGDQFRTILTALLDHDCGGVIMRPNSDAGGAQIDAVLDQLSSKERFVVCDHLDRSTYLGSLAQADLIVGNSSSGIIESASFDLPCLNIGTRQHGRLRNSNVIDCINVTSDNITHALQRCLKLGPGPFVNKYGDGRTAERLTEILKGLPLDQTILAKTNTY